MQSSQLRISWAGPRRLKFIALATLVGVVASLGALALQGGAPPPVGKWSVGDGTPTSEIVAPVSASVTYRVTNNGPNTVDVCQNGVDSSIGPDNSRDFNLSSGDNLVVKARDNGGDPPNAYYESKGTYQNL